MLSIFCYKESKRWISATHRRSTMHILDVRWRWIQGKNSCICNCVGNRSDWIYHLFQILTMNGDEVGKISKQWSGLMREMFTDADFFGINFPMDLDVRMKAVMLGACFLIVRTHRSFILPKCKRRHVNHVLAAFSIYLYRIETNATFCCLPVHISLCFVCRRQIEG